MLNCMATVIANLKSNCISGPRRMRHHFAPLLALALVGSSAAFHAPAVPHARPTLLRRPAAQFSALASRRAAPTVRMKAVAVPMPSEEPAPSTSVSPTPEAAEKLMDTKMAGLGVSWYQVCMVLFVALVYAADGAEVSGSTSANADPPPHTHTHTHTQPCSA